jgi:hypothetical protein
MNITISQISNGWIVALQTQQGAIATHHSTFGEVVDQLAEMNKDIAIKESMQQEQQAGD